MKNALILCTISARNYDPSGPNNAIYIPKNLPPGPSGFALFTMEYAPCETLAEAYYVVHPNTIAPPAGFSPIGGAPLAAPEYWMDTVSNYFRQPPALVSGQGQPSSEGPDYIPFVRPAEDNGEDDEATGTYRIFKDACGYQILAPKAKHSVRATNFLIELTSVEHHHYLYREGERFIAFSVAFPSGERVPLRISYERLKDILTIITAKIGESVLYRQHQKVFAEELQILLREELSACPHHHQICFTGWTSTPSGKFIYGHDGAVSPEPGISFHSGFRFGPDLANRSEAQIVADALRILGLSADPAKIVVPFLWAHTGLVWTLFEQAGYPPHSLLFIEGTTGSLKTAVSSLVFNFSGLSDQRIPATFRDTSASMEVKMGTYRDRVLLVDDFCPAADPASRRTMDQNLEQLVRFFGDGIARSRTNPKLEETYEKRPHGLCVVTGEDTAGSQSSLLRCLFLRVEKGTYDKLLLHQFQERPELWTAYLAQFVTWVAPHAEAFIAHVRQEFPVLRRELERHLKERRLVDTASWLILTGELVARYVSEVLPSEQGDILPNFADCVIRACTESEAKANTASPARIFALTLLELINRGDVRLVSQDCFETSPKDYLGVVQGDHWFLWPKETFSAITKSYAAGGTTFPLSMGGLWGALVSAGVLIPTEVKSKGTNRLEYGTRIGFSGRPRMLKIVPERLHELADSDE